MTHDELVNDVCQLEYKSGCHDVRINDISVYHFVRREIRTLYLAQHGYDFKERQAIGSKKDRIISVLKSIKHLMTLPKRFSVLFRTFRLEEINGLWMDRFYDPIIEECELNDYVILETNNGRHYKNRCHEDHIYFDDLFSLKAKVFGILFSNYYKKKYKEDFAKLFNAITSFIPDNSVDKKFCYDRIITCLLRVSFYKRLLKKKHVKVVIAASRSSFMPLTCAAKLMGLKVYELQHGIVYGESITYSGYRDTMFVPDKFLLFGEVYPQNVYGIEEKNLINIGWALRGYVDKLHLTTKISDKDILVLSQPQSTEYILDSLFYFAENHLDINFYLRCHPMERLSSEQMELINNHPNVYLQDNKTSFIMGIVPFVNVVGDQSTAIYEALSYGKKTGLLTMNGHEANLLEENDADCFWLINDNKSFDAFVNGDRNAKKTKSIYSPFDINCFNHLIN